MFVLYQEVGGREASLAGAVWCSPCDVTPKSTRSEIRLARGETLYFLFLSFPYLLCLFVRLTAYMKQEEVTPMKTDSRIICAVLPEILLCTSQL